MRNKIILLSVVAAAVAFATACNNSGSNKNKQTLVVATADAPEKYQCPMKCEGDTAYTTAGQCPVCEMDLEKLK